MPSAVRRAHRPGLESLEGRALLANAGALDPTFGDRGSMSLSTRASTDSTFTAVSNGQVAASAPGGKVVVFGIAQTSPGQDGDAVIERLDADGSLDPTFGQGGVVAITSKIALPSTVLVEPDGSILVAGQTFAGSSPYGLAHFKPDGTLDASFGIDGLASLPPYSPNNPSVVSVAAMTLTADGHILV